MVGREKSRTVTFEGGFIMSKPYKPIDIERPDIDKISLRDKQDTNNEAIDAYLMPGWLPQALLYSFKCVIPENHYAAPKSIPQCSTPHDKPRDDKRILAYDHDTYTPSTARNP
jgi:hypothetical protein